MNGEKWGKRLWLSSFVKVGVAPFKSGWSEGDQKKNLWLRLSVFRGRATDEGEGTVYGSPAERRRKWKIPVSPSGAGEKKKIPKGLGTVAAAHYCRDPLKWLQSPPFCKAGMR
uniref:Uncharacterized protein n=1 Tax=Populus alba TaxID=43335 RepID=A0A4U5QPF2_POPAL|nr:hypothetical protein D5086_0000074920 [Populus alba]